MRYSDKRQAESTGRRLMLLRHAKSAWPEGVPDKDRPLSERGIGAAAAMGAYMAREGLVPDLALVSTARRTQETWRLTGKSLAGVKDVRNVDSIYEAPAEVLRSVLGAVEPDKRCVLMIGHNPGMEDLAALLVGGGDAEGLRRMAEKYPTGALAVIDFGDGDWAHIAAGRGRLDRFVTPRGLE